MTPFRISKREYASYRMVEQTINLDYLVYAYVEQKTVVTAASRIEHQISFLWLNNPIKSEAAFNTPECRDACFEDLNKVLVEMRTGVRTEYIPA